MLFILYNVKFYVTSYLYSGLVITSSCRCKPKAELCKYYVFFVLMFILLYFQFEIEIEIVYHVWAYLCYPTHTKYFVRPPKLSLEYTWATPKHILALPIKSYGVLSSLPSFFLYNHLNSLYLLLYLTN